MVLALLFALSPWLAAGPGEEPGKKTQTFAGKVQSLSGVLDKWDVKLDPDAAPTWYALVTDDGKIYPLIKDAGGRMFFKDKRLVDRPMRVTGRVLPNSQLLQVLQVQSVVNGKPHEVFYWCDVCSIKRFENMICECCGGPMELRETPIKD